MMLAHFEQGDSPSARDLRKAITAALRGRDQSDAPEAVDRVVVWLQGLESAAHIAERFGCEVAR